MKQLTLENIISKLGNFNSKDILELSLQGIELDLSYESYRGYYEDLAFGYKEKDNKWIDTKVTVGGFLDVCKDAVDSYLYGWKGGEFPCSNDTLCWLSNEGITSSLKIMDVIQHNNKVFLVTIYDQYHEE